MSEREELEAVIARAVQSTHGTPADIANALINSGYTKGNGELVEAVPPNDWHPLRGGDFRQWGPWVRHDGGARPENVRFDDGKGFHGDPVVYLTQSGSGVGRNHSPYWPDIKWYRLPSNHSFYRKALSDSEGVAPSGGDAGRELIPVEVLQKVIEIQTEGRDMHPLTCPNRGDAHHAAVFDNGADIDVGTLMPTSAYLVCVACGYQQDYSHPAAQFLLEAARSAAQDTQRAERATNGDHHDEG